MTCVNKVKNSLLFLTQPLDNLKFNLKHLLEESFKYTDENLYIYFNPLLNKSPKQETSSVAFTPQLITDKFKLKHILHNFYQNSYKLNPSVNVTCLLNNVHASKFKDTFDKKSTNFEYDMILTDLSTNSPLYPTLLKYFNSKPETKPIYSIRCENENTDTNNDQQSSSNDLIFANKLYKNTIMGGTFDRLHIGHKIMLSEAILLTENRLLVGITDECMLTRKKLAELIEPFDTRCANLKKFLNIVASDLEVSPVNISDPYGPSIVERDYQCLIVSRETFKTGEMINTKRAENQLPELEIHVVELIPDFNGDLGDEDKVSSSNKRRHHLGTLLKAPYIPYNSSKPYVIGLTGGLASGKSNIRNDLEELGAATIDCDKLGHLTYEKGTDTYKSIIQTFGSEILDNSGVINRKLLGGKVFNNKDELKKLTDIVWPEIQKLLDKQIESLFSKGNRIIVVEAALLLDANWNANMNEVWVSFIPDEEAIKRSIARDNSNEEKVKGILNSQMRNKDRIAMANVVFSSLWEREYTKSQVVKAWKLLQERTVTNSKL